MPAPIRQRGKRSPPSPGVWKKFQNFFKDKSLSSLLTNPNSSWIIAYILLIVELFITFVVINKIPYTEIDWKAYMQEVEGVLNGTLDYKELRGDTGPLVYPAGFVYIFTLLYGVTQRGTNIYIAQHIFAALYLSTLYLVFRLYKKTSIIPPYALIFMCCTSYRIHSIYVLRLFNDPVAIFLLFVAVNCFASKQWTFGCVFYSIAVSVKMNILLFAPGLLFILMSSMKLQEVVKNLSLCAGVQIILGLPFLVTHPISYITGSFNMGRVFLYEWTVNWRLLPEKIFLNPYFHITLLLLHIIFICIFFIKWNRNFHSRFTLWPRILKSQLSIDDILLILFTSNFLGMVFCRSLHYQFYVWYFFTLPYLLWSTPFSSIIKLSLLGILELTWNIYPSTVFSSLAMHCCHLVILFGLLYQKRTKVSESKHN